MKPKAERALHWTLVGYKGNQDNASLLSEQLSCMMHLEGSIPHVIVPDLCQVIWSGPAHKENEFEIFAGYVVEDAIDFPESLDILQLESKRNAVFNYVGDAISLKEFLSGIYEQWLPASQYEHNNSTFNHIQFVKMIHSTDNVLPTNKQEFSWDIWIPVK
jgi:predicted transcriptional regulator YdeE